MNNSAPRTERVPGAFGRMLRFWRGTMSLSQEELGMRTGMSTRHISFLENGRSMPSREAVLDIAATLGLGREDQDNLLVASGLMPNRVNIDLGDESLRWLRKALNQTLMRIEPSAAVITDRYANVLLVNRGWLALHRQCLPATELEAPLNLYHLLFSEDGLRPLLVDWDQVACRLLMTLQQEVLLSGDAQAQHQLDSLLEYPAIPDDWQRRAIDVQTMNSFRMKLRWHGDREEDFLHVTTTFGSLPYVAEPRLFLTLMIPNNDELAAELAALSQACEEKHSLLCD